MKNWMAINVIIGTIVIASVGYFSKEVWLMLAVNKAEKVQSQLEQTLFPLMLQAQPREAIFARPMYVIQTADTLTVYTEYLGEKSVDAREVLRVEMVSVVKKWAETQPTKYKFIYVTFTDEVMAPEKK